jgi:putative transposase
MIDRDHGLAIARQSKLLGISRGSVYYRSRPVSARDLAVMRRMDELHLDHPFAGSRMLRDLLSDEGVAAGRRHVGTLMKRMGIEAIYRRPNTSRPAPGHKIYPYLLRNVSIDRPNQVWATDITYVPMARGFVYLCAVVDWFSRRVLSHRVSVTMEASFCIEAVEEALGRYGKPDIFNTDQGSQFTCAEFVGTLSSNGIAISMDGRGSRAATTYSSRGSGARSNTRRSISEPTKPSAMRALPSPVTSTSIIANGPIRALTGRRQTRLTSTGCRFPWRPNMGRRSTYKNGIPVQIPGATSESHHVVGHRGFLSSVCVVTTEPYEDSR